MKFRIVAHCAAALGVVARSGDHATTGMTQSFYQPDKNQDKAPRNMKFALALCVFVLTIHLSGNAAPAAQDAHDTGWTERVVSEEELLEIERNDPSLDINTCREILARINTREPYYIREDMRNGRKIRVPDDFRAFRDWTPLPLRLNAAARSPKFILVVKGIPFIGWYESGVLAGDSQACIGDSGQDTKAGFYRVQEKDADHVSRSYPNEYGSPAWMPFSLRIYETVWIHAGNVFGARCSHGCVILPVEKAENLFRWADSGTDVLVVESLEDLKKL
ncbi:MAG: L,D-transpeptidase [Syntrophobacteraceae bacterium]